MIKIDSDTGSALMKTWGVFSWPDFECDYFLWNSCAVFACMDFGDHVDLHMAMEKSNRRRCREAVRDILTLIGDRVIRAPILEESKHVCNLAKKFGFVETWRGETEFFDGRIGGLIIMTRGGYGRDS